MNIDVDSHFTPLTIFENIPPSYSDAPTFANGRLTTKNGMDLNVRRSTWDVEMRIDAMREAGFDKQCLNVALLTIPEWWISPETELYLTRAWNDQVAKVLQSHDCFVGIAQVPHRDPIAAALEAERAIKDLGFSAINVEGHWAGKNLASSEWHDFFHAVEKLDVPIVSHPTGRSSKDTFDIFMAGHEQLEKIISACGGLLGFLVQHQIAMASVIFLGVLDECPRLKFAWMETDVGWVPTFVEMLEGFYNTHKIYRTNFPGHPLKETQIETIDLKKSLAEYFKDNFYYSLNFAKDFELNYMMPLVIEKTGLGNNIMIESDFDHNEGDLDIVRRIMQTQTISDESKEKICGRNAADLFKIKWAPSAYEGLYA